MMLTRSIIKRCTQEERKLIREGGFYMGFITAGIAYYNYRQFLKKDFLRSEAHYRFSERIQNMTPWKQLYFTWWRMPDEEYNVYHRFKPYYVIGQIDQSKEILIPRTRNILGQKADGYDVINPLYCYEGGRLSFKKVFDQKDPISIERAPIIINRGWIPKELKDKRSRPNELNTRKLVKITGVFLKGKNIHDYKIPNNPDNNEWHNLSLEDIGIYWDLPNFDEIKHYYFQVVDFPSTPKEDTEEENIQFPIPQTPDEVIDNFYKWKFTAQTNQNLFRVFTLVSAVSFFFTFIA